MLEVDIGDLDKAIEVTTDKDIAEIERPQLQVWTHPWF